MKSTAIQIVEKLQEAGYTAYWAGGCVRDMLLGIEPKDYDIATNAGPDEVQKMFKITRPVGESFGVILVIEPSNEGAEKQHAFEVATFRKESEYEDGRRPKEVHFCEAEEDAKRRDFTINALFYDPIAEKLIDYVGGEADLKEKLLRFIGDAHERILEDHLRIVRAVRFKNAYSLQYHPETYLALKKHAHLAKYTARERLRDELNKMINADNAANAFEELSDIGILKEILPELENMRGVAQPMEYHHEGDVWDHSKQALASLPKDASLKLRWATFLHDVGKPDTFKLAERIRFDGHCEASAGHTRNILTRLRFPRKFIDEVCEIVEHHMMMVPLTEMAVGRRRHWFLKPWFKTLLGVFKADAEGTTPTDLSLYKQIKELYDQDMKEISQEPEKLLSGEEIMEALNLKPGAEIGDLLQELRELQLEGSIKTKEEAEKWLKSKN